MIRDYIRCEATRTSGHQCLYEKKVNCSICGGNFCGNHCKLYVTKPGISRRLCKGCREKVVTFGIGS